MPVEARYIQQLTEHIDRLLPDAPERAEAVLRALIKQRCPRVARGTFFKGGMVYIINRREISTAEAKAILAEPHWQEQLRADFLWTPSGPDVAAPGS
jgi:hypothetical protein